MELKDKLNQRLSYLFCTPEERVFKHEHLTQENVTKVLSLKDKYAGKRCFVAGTSPSVNLLDLNKLNNEFVFTVNRGYMLKEKGLMHSTFHVISDTNTFKDEGSKWEEMADFSKQLFCYAGMKAPPVNMDTIYFDYIQYQLNKAMSFQDDLTKPLIAYQSVIHFAIQIAYYLGFREIYMFGVDLDFAKNTGHAYQETSGEKEREKTASVVNAEHMLYGIGKCGEWLSQHGVTLKNASPCGIVDCIERVKYEELFR